MKASELQELQKGRVLAIDLKEEDTKRLFYMGIYPGSQIQFLHTAPLHDPYLFYVQGSLLMLRRCDAQRIEVELL